MAQLQEYKEKIKSLQRENEYLRNSKMALISSTSAEIERLRKFITLLANALRGQSYTARDVKDIQNIISSNTPAVDTMEKETEPSKVRQNRIQFPYCFKSI